MTTDLDKLATELETETATLDRELAEIELLLRQAGTEAERLEARRAQAEERARTLERDGAPPADQSEARTQLLAETRRQTLMGAQVDVLAGKQRALQRYRDRMADVLPALRAPAQASAAAERAAANGRGQASRDVLAAQEQLRRDISRQMHDGPAQSIANIALQAQVVQRLLETRPQQAQAELSELVRMVEAALEATKNFIFDVRPMVLDDLGLVPTLRRASLERGRRSGVPVRFESVGADRRLASDLESSFFRMVDDAVVGYLSGRPHDLAVRLDWTEEALRGTIQARSSADSQTPQTRAHAVVAAARHQKTMPAALASMIRDQEHETELRATGLSEAVWSDLSTRGETVGLDLTLSADRATLEVVASTHR